MSKSILCIFLSFSLTLLLSHSRSLTHFPTLLVFSAVSPHNLKLTGGRGTKKVRDLMESKEGKEKQFLRVKVAKN